MKSAVSTNTKPGLALAVDRAVPSVTVQITPASSAVQEVCQLSEGDKVQQCCVAM